MKGYTCEGGPSSYTPDSGKFGLGCRGFDSRGSDFRRCWSSGSIQISQAAGSEAAWDLPQRPRPPTTRENAAARRRWQPHDHTQGGRTLPHGSRGIYAAQDEFKTPRISTATRIRTRMLQCAGFGLPVEISAEHEYASEYRKDLKNVPNQSNCCPLTLC